MNFQELEIYYVIVNDVGKKIINVNGYVIVIILGLIVIQVFMFDENILLIL